MRAGAGRRPWRPATLAAPCAAVSRAAGARSRSRRCAALARLERDRRAGGDADADVGEVAVQQVGAVLGRLHPARATIARGVASVAGAPREVLADRPRRDVAQVARRPDAARASSTRRARCGRRSARAPSGARSSRPRGPAAARPAGARTPRAARSAFMRHSVAARRSSAAAWPGIASARSHRSLAARARAAGPPSALRGRRGREGHEGERGDDAVARASEHGPQGPPRSAAPCRLECRNPLPNACSMWTIPQPRHTSRQSGRGAAW